MIDKQEAIELINGGSIAGRALELVHEMAQTIVELYNLLDQTEADLEQVNELYSGLLRQTGMYEVR